MSETTQEPGALGPDGAPQAAARADADTPVAPAGTTLTQDSETTPGEPDPAAANAAPPEPAAGWTSGQAQADPAGLPQPVAVDPEAAARRAARRRNALRWVGAVAVAAVVGAGCATLVLHPKRTDVPGLATKSDGRYTFAALKLPALPGGLTDPDQVSNSAGAHLADIRKLLLLPPQGAVASSALPGTHGWVSTADAIGLFSYGLTTQDFGQYGLRHTAGEEWKTPDGATTKIYLLQFADSNAAAVTDNALGSLPAGVPSSVTAQPGKVLSAASSVSVVKSGSTTTRYGAFFSGDTMVLVVFSGPTSIGAVPFQQIMDLQDEMLQ